MSEKLLCPLAAFRPFGNQQEFTFAKTVKINWLKVNVNFNSFI